MFLICTTIESHTFIQVDIPNSRAIGKKTDFKILNPLLTENIKISMISLESIGEDAVLNKTLFCLCLTQRMFGLKSKNVFI